MLQTFKMVTKEERINALLNNYYNVKRIRSIQSTQTINSNPQEIRDAIEKLKEREMKRNTLNCGNSMYHATLLDDSLTLPLELNSQLLRTANEKFIPVIDRNSRGKAIFDWVHENIVYGTEKRNDVGYRNSLETFFGKEGVCGEMAYVNIILARASGLKANYVSVKEDLNGDSVNHGCAGIYVPELVLSDVAYHTYGIQHKKYNVLNDAQMVEKFNSWRN